MMGPTPGFDRDDPRDLGDVERLLRRIDHRLAAVAEQQTAIIPIQPPAPPPPPPPIQPVVPVSVNLFENISVKLVSVITLVIVIGGATFSMGKWVNSSDSVVASITGVKTALQGEIKGLGERIDRQNDSFYERMSFAFTDFCRRTERENPNWRCADPITMPLDPAAGKFRFRGTSGAE